MKTRVVLITGALTGMGRAMALSFAHEGARIVVSGRHDEAGKALATELRTLGVEAEFVRADVRHEDDVRSLVDKTVARFGMTSTTRRKIKNENETTTIQERDHEPAGREETGNEGTQGCHRP